MEIDVNHVEMFANTTREQPEFKTQCIQLAKDISTGKTTMLQVVEQLGVYLVDKDNDRREFGMWILSEVLLAIPGECLDSGSVHFIGDFYAQRLKDTHQVIPAVLTGLCAICKFPTFPTALTQQILANLFGNISCQQQQQQDRFNIYTVFSLTLEKSPHEIQEMGVDYVYGVISAVDGERDPKNLLFLFNWYPKFLNIVDLKHLTEEMFEIISCYFPVDFKAPVQDPNAITRDILADALSKALTAIPQFAQFCIPLALEKLDSSLTVAKCDALRLLQVGCSTFDVDHFEQFSNEIWSKIVKELLSNNGFDVDNNAKKTLERFLRKLETSALLQGILVNIADTLKRNLSPDSKLFTKTASIFLTIAKSCRKSTTFTTNEIVPILINTFNITSTAKQKAILLEILVEFLAISLHFHESLEDNELKSIPNLCLKSMENENVKEVAYSGLKRITLYLNPSQREVLYENLKEIRMNNVSNAIIVCFTQLAIDYPEEIRANFIEERFLYLLSAVGHLDSFTSTTIDLFLQCLPSSVELFKDFVQKNSENKSIQNVLREKNVIGTLIFHGNCEESASCIIKTIIQQQNQQEQQTILDESLEKLFHFDEEKRVLMLHALLINIRREVRIIYDLLLDFVIVFAKEHPGNLTSAKLLASILNKCCNEQLLGKYLAMLEENWDDFSPELLAFVVKALVLRNHSKARLFIDKLIITLQTNVEISKCFHIVINDRDESFSGKSHCNISILWQQKVFVTVSNKLSETYQPGNVSYLMALCYLLEFTPITALRLQFDKILKLIILSLELITEPEALRILLNVLKELTVRKETCIEDHFQEILTRILDLTRFEQSMEIRINALQLMQSFTHFPVYKLLPLRNAVLQVLGKCIDDKKRLVRTEAVEARMTWFLIDSPV